jgi:hypothetical protein
MWDTLRRVFSMARSKDDEDPSLSDEPDPGDHPWQTYLSRDSRKSTILHANIDTHDSSNEDYWFKNPDNPQPFGYKTNWLAVKTKDIQHLIEALSIQDSYPSNWQNGLITIEGCECTVFVTPPLDEWILVIGVALPEVDSTQSSERLSAWIMDLSKLFGDVHYYSNESSNGVHCWAKASHGVITRARAMCHSSRSILWNVGEVTEDELLAAKELKLDVRLFDTLVSSDGGHHFFTDSEYVLELSKIWDIDTSFEKRLYPKSLGQLGTFKPSMSSN